MKHFWFHLLVIVIALTSLPLRDVEFDFTVDQISSLDSTPAWDTDSLKNPKESVSQKTYYIADAFIPIVVLSNHSEPRFTHGHYLPLHELIRENDFFLLI